MKHPLRGTILLLSLAGLLTATAAAQSLGEYARQQRAKKGPTPASVKEYTNDNLPASGGLGTVSSSRAATANSGSSATSSAAKGTGDADSDKERSKLEAEWRAKFAEQKTLIATLQRELDVAMRENNSRQAQTQTNSQDLGSRLRNPVLWAAENKRYQDEVDGKKKDLEAAKQKLEDMKDDLRKAGLPNTWAD
jgi:Skp family chaperone for outer membrane proteins